MSMRTHTNLWQVGVYVSELMFWKVSKHWIMANLTKMMLGVSCLVLIIIFCPWPNLYWNYSFDRGSFLSTNVRWRDVDWYWIRIPAWRGKLKSSVLAWVFLPGDDQERQTKISLKWQYFTNFALLHLDYASWNLNQS